MIETKIKCEGPSYLHFRAQAVTLEEAVSGNWWEIEIHPGSIAYRQPKTSDSFNPNCKHACCPEHAREIIQEEINKSIQDEVIAVSRVEETPVKANEPESDIPF